MKFMLEMTADGGPRERRKEWDVVATITLISNIVYCRSPYGLPQSRPCHFGESPKHCIWLHQPTISDAVRKSIFHPEAVAAWIFVVVKVPSSDQDNKLS